jgi:hypothetical protein
MHGMDDPGNRLLQEAQVLLSAAQQFERDAGDRSSATAVAPALACVEQALQALSRACEGSARAIIPASALHESSSTRFARAAAAWPSELGGAAPSYEQQVRLLSSLHDAAAALRVAATSTARARDIVASKVPAASRMRAAA